MVHKASLTRSVVSIIKPLPTHSEGYGGRTFACSLSLTLTPGKAIFTAGSVFLNGFSIWVFTMLGSTVRSITVCISRQISSVDIMNAKRLRPHSQAFMTASSQQGLLHK